MFVIENCLPQLSNAKQMCNVFNFHVTISPHSCQALSGRPLVSFFVADALLRGSSSKRFLHKEELSPPETLSALFPCM